MPLVLRPSHIRLQIYLSFASGAMLGAAICHMLPEASRQEPQGWSYWTLLGLLAIFFLQRFFAFHHHEMPGEAHGHRGGPDDADASHLHEHIHGHGPSTLAWRTVFLGMSLHTLTGGFALASAVAAGSGKPSWVGLSVFLATILHKPADSLTITSLMLSEGASRRRMHLTNFGFAIMIPVGAMMYFFLSSLGTASPGYFGGSALAFSAGTFLSIALGDLMPELQFHRHDRIKLSAALLAGVGLMALSAWVE